MSPSDPLDILLATGHCAGAAADAAHAAADRLLEMRRVRPGDDLSARIEARAAVRTARTACERALAAALAAEEALDLGPRILRAEEALDGEADEGPFGVPALSAGRRVRSASPSGARALGERDLSPAAPPARRPGSSPASRRPSVIGALLRAAGAHVASSLHH